jgi:deoxycytidine triphosphate deaminase
MIQCERWIRKMAKEHGMIHPLEEKQMREHPLSFAVRPSRWIFEAACDPDGHRLEKWMKQEANITTP